MLLNWGSTQLVVCKTWFYLFQDGIGRPSARVGNYSHYNYVTLFIALNFVVKSFYQQQLAWMIFHTSRFQKYFSVSRVSIPGVHPSDSKVGDP